MEAASNNANAVVPDQDLLEEARKRAFAELGDPSNSSGVRAGPRSKVEGSVKSVDKDAPAENH